MLERLTIESIALIEKLDVEFSKGLTVLTGETGAGKSIIIDGVNIVLGGRASKELISHGKQKARVEAFFDISSNDEVNKQLAANHLDAEDGTLAITREISIAGKSVCRINGEIVQLSTLRGITALLVDVHGQHEHQSLLDDKNHLAVIDAYMLDEIQPLIDSVNSAYDEFMVITAELNSGFISETERARRIDILEYQIDEIAKAELSDDEEDRINEELLILSNSEKISNALGCCGELLSGENGMIGDLKEAYRSIEAISALSQQFDQLSARLDSVYYELEDISYVVRDLRYSCEYDPQRLDVLQMRLELINSLKHKYGRTISEVLNYKSKAEEELNKLIGSEERRKELAEKRDKAKEKYFSIAERLTYARMCSAQKLCSLAEKELKLLGMKNARLRADFIETDGELHPNGVDSVSLMLSANVGEPMKPLSKVASGGELSRIMLALKTVITEADGIQTLIFDEVDTGISGSTANVVGQRMRIIASRHQVLCVTHLPQIAAFADEHFLVRKSELEGKTVTNLKKLENEERVAELARIMGAETASDVALLHARELIESAAASVV